MNFESELWLEPRKSLERDFGQITCEMTKHEHAFLCGMIKQAMPKKIIEIGVAEGGTTSVILRCLSMLDLESEMWSIDLSKQYYKDKQKRTGYECERLKEYIDTEKIKHHFLLGVTIADVIEEIGNGIDFVIIDTIHRLPGEILDFLCVLPYLRIGATVILHDIDLNFRRSVFWSRSSMDFARIAIATKLLYSAVAAEKHMVYEKGGKLPNIAGFITNNDTEKYIDNLFYILTMTWSYIPEQKMLNAYRNIFSKFYGNELVRLFDMAVKNNRRIWERAKLADKMDKSEEPPRIIYSFPYAEVPMGSRIVIYGAGKVGTECYEVQNKLGVYDIVAWVDREGERIRADVRFPDVLSECDFDYIIIAVESKKVYSEICAELDKKGLSKSKSIIGPIRKYQ